MLPAHPGLSFLLLVDSSVCILVNKILRELEEASPADSRIVEECYFKMLRDSGWVSSLTRELLITILEY